MNAFALALIPLTLGQTAPPSPEGELNTVLGTAGLSTRTARFDADVRRLFGQGEFTTPLYTALDGNPWRTPFVMGLKRAELAALAGRPSDSMASGGLWAGWGTRRTLIGDPIATAVSEAKVDGALANQFAALTKMGVLTERVPSMASVPPAVRQAAAIILRVVIDARAYRNLAVNGMGDLPAQFARLNRLTADEDVAASANLLQAYRKFRPQYLAAGAHDVLRAMQAAAPLAASVKSDVKYEFRLPTKWGVIRFSGGVANTHAEEPTLLCIDTGGNDTYVNGASTASADNWCSLVLDTQGDDGYVSALPLKSTTVAQYGSRKVGSLPGPAGAVMGVAAIYDLGGRDLYRSHRPGLGSGRLGVGVLYDAQGEDVYDAYADSQGFGLLGAGILEDDGTESDVYQGFTQVQGVGQTGGFGYLVDRGGNEVYTANDEVIDFPSPQSDKHNVSMSQGAGNGRRADYLDGQNLAGGVGILFDQRGDDRYSCGVFGQGVGYWMGVGSLWDAEGTDSYGGQWYVQGASAHFAFGYLEDMRGGDRYLSPMNMAQGAGHDFSVGILIDRAGNDRYTAPNLSLGAGNANGFGWFADLEGDDAYESGGITLGKAAEAPKDSVRSRALTLGVFMDLAGNDTYPAAAAWAKSGTMATNWTERLAAPMESQVGLFWDR